MFSLNSFYFVFRTVNFVPKIAEVIAITNIAICLILMLLIGPSSVTRYSKPNVIKQNRSLKKLLVFGDAFSFFKKYLNIRPSFYEYKFYIPIILPHI